MKSDFIIIGSGMAGMSAAYRLSKHGKVIVLEKESLLGYHTTGRSAAFFTENYGNKIIRSITKASRHFFENPPACFKENELMTNHGGSLFIANKNQTKFVDKELEYAKSLSANVFEISKQKALRMVPIIKKNYIDRALHEPDSKSMDVDLIHQGFARGLKSNNGDIIFNATVQKIKKISNDWKVYTKTDQYSSPIIINAAGAWCDDIAILAGCKPLNLKPKRRTVIIFESSKNINTSNWPVVIDIEDKFYFKSEAGKILASPADETDSLPCDAQPEEIDIAMTVDRIENATNFKIKRIEHKWAGLRSFFPDRTPIVGEDPSISNFYWLAGQGGYGIQTSPGISKIIECLITGKIWPSYLSELLIHPKTLLPNRNN
ncbi:MAG TPA: FAD-binding oxidoreductase [Alphaproteobacteria bacterium]|jgi:D-arginine dehydrogenase|nr:FAD-binding oxidoreductase [Alphaproteobacteria bacterium]